MSNIILPKEFAIPIIHRPVDDSCVLWISGKNRDSNTKIRDLSNYGNSGEITGVSWTNTPLNHPCLSFDGANDYVALGSTPQLDFPSSSFTYELWVKPSSLPAVARWILKGVANDTGWTIYGNDSNLIANIHNGGTVRSTTANSILTTDWQHIVYVRDFTGGSGKIYRNGIDVTTVSDAGSGQAATTQNAYIGIESNLTGYPFPGVMDEVRIYNRALSSKEIMQQYQNTKYLFGY